MFAFAYSGLRNISAPAFAWIGDSAFESTMLECFEFRSCGMMYTAVGERPFRYATMRKAWIDGNLMIMDNSGCGVFADSYGLKIFSNVADGQHVPIEPGMTPEDVAAMVWGGNWNCSVECWCLCATYEDYLNY